MNEKIKIVYIGAGSAAWALKIVRDLCVTDELKSSEIVFVDINEEKLTEIMRLAKRYNEVIGGKLKITGTASMKDALKDADFIINSVLAGAGHILQEKVRKVTEEMGYYRGIESREFNMISDYATMYSAVDQYNYIKNLTINIHDISPDAWLLSVSNPMFELQTLINRDKENKIKSVSYCDGTLHLNQIIKNFNLDGHNINVAGINHNIWITRSNQNELEFYEKLNNWIDKDSEKHWKNNSFYNTFDNEIDIRIISENVQFSRAAIDMYKSYGLFPVGDTVRSGTWKYHYNLQTKKKWYGPYGGFDSEIGWGRYLAALDMISQYMSNLYNVDKGTLLSIIPPEPGDDPVIPFIEGILLDRKIKAFFDVKNIFHGDTNVKYLPEYAAVEIPVNVDKNGIHPEKVLGLNDRVNKDVLVPRWVNLEMAISAYETGDKSVLLDALYRDPRTRSNEQAESTLEKVLSIPENVTSRNLYR